jgi:hypothetical protein
MISNIFSEGLDKCTPYNYPYYSSFVFILNILFAYYNQYYTYATLFFILLVTSIIHHSHYNETTCIIDKIAVYMVVFYGGYLFYHKIMRGLSTTKEYIMSFVIVFTFLLTGILYHYGKMNQCFCFYHEESIAARYHALMHIIASIGHICIAVL